MTVVGDNLYSASNDGSIKIWHLPSMEPGPTLTSHSEAVRKIKILPSGDVISADDGGFVSCVMRSAVKIAFFVKFLIKQMQVWSGEESKQAFEPIGEEIWDLAVDPEGFVYTARDRDVTVWFLKGIFYLRAITKPHHI
jgi:WD40 repeat protein